MTASQVAAVRAHANIALAKYWGKAEVARNLTAVPSLSLTLEAMRTTTRVEFSAELSADSLMLAGAPQVGKPLERARALLGAVRALAGTSLYARVESVNDFPTASGLASSASGFAALALASVRALGLDLSLAEVSAIARAASASAARSLFGGYVELGAAAERAERVLAGDAWPLRMLVAVTSEGAKETGSTDGMQHTARTSPYYPTWLVDAPRTFDEVKAAVLTQDFERLAPAVEQSTLMMHASMLAASPALWYFKPATVAVLDEVRRLRREGHAICFTMDAGPHVKVLCEASAEAAASRGLASVPGVVRVLRSGPGPDAQVLG